MASRESRTSGSRTKVGDEITGKIVRTDPPDADSASRAAYTGPEPGSGVTMIATSDALVAPEPRDFDPGGTDPFGSTIGTSTDELAGICTTCPPDPEDTASGASGAATVILTLAARPGADSISSDLPSLPAGFAAITPCSAIAADPVMKTPGAPA